MRDLRALLTLMAFLGLAAPVHAAPRLVRDLNTGPGSEVHEIFVDGTNDDPRILFFDGDDPAHGLELWRSDGTPAGTWRLTDICSGRCGSRPGPVTVVRGRLFFTADDGVSGRELWESDGTPGSERRVRDLCPGPCSSRIDNFLALDDRLLFTVLQGNQLQLWRTDGSAPGTTSLLSLCTLDSEGNCGGFLGFGGLYRAGRLAFFSVPGASGPDLWRSDGTPEGTRPVRASGTPGTPPFNVAYVIPVGNSGFYFTDGALWKTDGTAAGTVRVKALAELVAGDRGIQWTAVWNGLFYWSFTGGQLVRSDGTPGGTSVFAELPAGDTVTSLAPTSRALLFLVREPGQDDPTALWRTEGTRETTAKVYDSGPAAFLNGLIPLGDRALLDGYRRNPGTFALWVTDGTAAGTKSLVLDIGGYAGYPVAVGDQAFWLPRNLNPSEVLWRTDGTPAGTFPVRDFHGGAGSAGPLAQAVLGGKLLFSARTSATESQLSVSDGTRAGTHVLRRDVLFPADFTRVGERDFFTATGADGFFGLWWTDGTAEGTARIKTIASQAGPLTALGSQILFPAQLTAEDADPYGLELWHSNGMPRGTRMVKDIDPFQTGRRFFDCGGESSQPGRGLPVGSALVFAADDGAHGRELWRSDGTAKGTRLVRDINPGRAPRDPDFAGCNDRTDAGLPSDPDGFVAFRGGALFVASDGGQTGEAGRELWWTDGTTAGTRLVKDLRPGPEGSAPHDLTVFGDAVYFFASTGGAGESLWRSDGTARGTVLVDDLTVGGTPSWARSLTAVGGRLFFTVDNEATGAELWTSRGDAASTGLVVDLRPGPAGSSPRELTAVGNVLVFAADDGVTGVEPWRSDGTAAGTRRLGDINPGPDASSPGPFSMLGGAVLTGAWDPAHGRELWSIPVADVLRP